jgi:hypothetical protein
MKAYTYYHGTDIGSARQILEEKKIYGTITKSKKEALQYAKRNAWPESGIGALVTIKTYQKLPYRPSGGQNYKLPVLEFNKEADELSAKKIKFTLKSIAKSLGKDDKGQKEFIDYFNKLKKENKLKNDK